MQTPAHGASEASQPALSRAALLAYASVRLPVALLELPMFILLPMLYHREFGLALTTIGAVLFVARALDAVLDPFIGRLIDHRRRDRHFAVWVRGALPVLALAFIALLMPPVRGTALVVWLAILSILAYAAYSTVSIAHQAWGASLGGGDAQQARITSTREAFGLGGVLLALGALSPERTVALSCAVVVLVTIALVWSRTAPLSVASGPVAQPAGPLPAGRQSAAALPEEAVPGGAPPDGTPTGRRTSLLANSQFRWLLAAFLFNGVATAIPATLVLFFASDVLKASNDQTAVFLAIYFAAAALGMPVWLALSRRLGLRTTWVLGMAIAVLGFVWTLGLDAHDHLAFGIICAATGWALGSDLAMPPALLASCIAANGDRGTREGSYFGIWNFVTKLNLALAAGLALPLVEWSTAHLAIPATQSLAYIYAGLPSLLKMVAAYLVLTAPWPQPDDPTWQR